MRSAVHAMGDALDEVGVRTDEGAAIEHTAAGALRAAAISPAH
jgi:hypothetical protein